MKYLQTTIEVKKERLELLVGNLEDEGFEELIINDPADAEDIVEHKDLYKYDYLSEEVTANPDRWPTITIYLPDDEDGMQRMQDLRGCIMNTVTYLEDMGNHEASYDFIVSEELTDDADWLYKWQEYFKPTKVSERLVVKPTWENYEPAIDPKTGLPELVIEIDPGMAFGTGTHETTSMCMKALEKAIAGLQGQTYIRVLDVGCGSGILSIAAALLGASETLGIEIDTEALKVAESNVELNGLGAAVRLQYGDLTEGVDFTADIIAANLMSDLVIRLTPDAARHLTKGGIYISSGILLEKEQQVSEAIEKAGFTITESLHDGEWCAIVARLN